MRSFKHPAVWVMCIALLSPVASNTAMAQNTVQIDSIVALVDDDVILRSELEIATKGIVDRIRQQGGDLPPKSLLEKQVLDRLIIRRLQLLRAYQTGIRISDADIDQSMMMLAQQNQISLMQLRQVIEADGEDFAEFRQNIGEEMMTERLRQRVVNSMDPITETEIDILLASEGYSTGEYNISHILIGMSEGATPPQIAAAETKANNVYQQLEEGLDFASAAISYSDAQEALEGGLVGWRDLNSVPVVFSESIKNLRAGQMTTPIRSPAGFHIIKVNDYRERSQVLATEYHARHIMVETNDLVGPREAMEQIRDIHQQLIDGADFAELAREYSDDVSSANLGGDMGWFLPKAFGERMEQTLTAMDDGEISEAFQTESGWHIIERLGTREKDVTVESTRNAARANLQQRKMDIEVEQFLQQMRDEAFVEIRLDS
ncbi:MAG: peptidylprolyl isomerase [Xanthomonadales bacterium]|nr:peptidylprolyl isomerase [Xanthomonadales bacterium]